MESVLGNMNPVLQMLTVMTMFSLLPFVFCCMTCFLRFTIVFSLLKTAMGVQVPPSIVTIGLCMILTFYTMGGVFEKMYERGSIPYQKSQNLSGFTERVIGTKGRFCNCSSVMELKNIFLEESCLTKDENVSII